MSKEKDFKPTEEQLEAARKLARRSAEIDTGMSVEEAFEQVLDGVRRQQPDHYRDYIKALKRLRHRGREPLKPGKPLSDKDKQSAFIEALLKDIKEKR